MNKELPLEKLPKWAQEHIEKIQRQRDSAVRTLNEFKDSQTKSPISYTDHPCLGEASGPSFVTRFIQTDTIKFLYAGVRLDVSTRNEEIQLSWSGKDGIRDAALIPYGYNQMKIVCFTP